MSLPTVKESIDRDKKGEDQELGNSQSSFVSAFPRSEPIYLVQEANSLTELSLVFQ